MKPPTNPPQQGFSNSNIISGAAFSVRPARTTAGLPAPGYEDQLERRLRRTGWILFAAITMIDLAVTFGPHLPTGARLLKAVAP